MKKRFVLLALAGISSHGALCAASPPAADGDARLDEARTHFQRGVELYKERNFDAALVEFTRAYSVAENYRLLYNIGQVHFERHDYVAALKNFRQYLQAGGSDVPASRRDSVEQEIATLERRVARVRIDCNVSGAEILIDQTPVGTTPLDDAVLVNPGTRQVTARKPGYEGQLRSVTIAGAEMQDVVLTLLRATEPQSDTRSGTPPPAPTPRVVAPPEKRSASRAPLWIGITTTGLLAGGAGVFGFLTVRSNRRLDDELGTFPANSARIGETRREIERNALITDVLAGAALLSGGVTLVIGLSSSGDSDEATRVTLRAKAGQPALELGTRF
jgi:hypothetical protein